MTTIPVQPKGFSDHSSKTEARLGALKQEGRAAFIGYMPFGFPTPELSIRAMQTMVEHHVDIVEIGLPYSDPVMDGPVIQSACTIALDHHAHIADSMRAVQAVDQFGAVPLIMSYYNLLVRYGVESFASDAAQAGCAGFIIPDLIVDEADELTEAAQRNGLDQIFLASPDSSDERLDLIAKASRGFVYAVSRMGVTGQRSSIDQGARGLVERIRAFKPSFVCLGIGVSNAEQAKEVGQYADGVIVGSALVKTMLDENNQPVADIEAGLAKLAHVCDDIAEGLASARSAE